MLSYSLRELAKGAVQVGSALAPDDAVWVDGDIRPEGPLRVTGRLSGAGTGRYYFSGAFEGTAAGECRRCLVPVQGAVRGDLHVLYADADDENADEPDVYPLGDGGTTIDLRPAVREQWLLEAPALPLCRPECLGLCSVCGADRNQGPCGCTSSSV